MESQDEIDPRYVRSWKCQVSVGELYRWILAKLSDKDIKRALHKYRDLMPRQSDWNRKLTQATNIPELGFRYLYRCGQIDESNHRTMQKMLKYIDRQDVLPYFDTILYNTNCANYSLNELKKVLLDKVEEFLKYSTALTEEEVHPEPPYEINQCQPLENLRVTRSRSKRRATDDHIRCLTVAKRMRRNSLSVLCNPSVCSNEQGTSKTESVKNTQASIHNLAAGCCGQVRSAIMAGALGGPVVHALLSSSLISMLNALRVTLSQAISPPAAPGYQNNPAGRGLSPARLLAAMPHLLALARINPPPAVVCAPQPLIQGAMPPGYQNDNGNNNVNHNVPQPPNHQPQMFGQAAGIPAHPNIPPGMHSDSRQMPTLSGGVGITASPNDSCIYYYCCIRLRIKIDAGPMTELLVS